MLSDTHRCADHYAKVLEGGVLIDTWEREMLEVLADALMAADDAARGAPTQDGRIAGLS